jgi:type I restriction enzyme, S subunit
VKTMLTEHMPIVASSSGGVKKLRELILQLAVMGKLVPQDARDEPASKLVPGICRKEQNVENSERLLPNGWCWFTISDVATIRGGCTPSMSTATYWGGDIPWISPKDMHAGAILDSELKITEKALEETSLELLPPGTLLIVGRSGILKRKLPVQITVKPCTINQDLKALTFPPSFEPIFMRLLLLGHQRQILNEDVKQGTTVQSLVYDRLFARRFALPPVAEQHRIVAKVDDLLALCDRLEAQQADAESAHMLIVKTLLETLTQGKDPSDFATGWERIKQNFDTLFTTEGSIEALKHALLQLAVMGKLVPQNPNDEPVSELLKRVKADKERLVRNGLLKKTAVAIPISDEEIPYRLPTTWEWARFGSIAYLITDGTHYTPKYQDNGRPFLSVKDISSGYLDFSDTRFISEEEHQKLIERCRPERGDVLLTKIGSNTGIAVLIDTDEEFSIFVSLALIKLPPALNGRYFELLLNSPLVRVQSGTGTEGTGHLNLVLRKIVNFILPMPPLDEQCRIVTKVQELMALCEQLKAELASAQALQKLIAARLIEEAVNGKTTLTRQQEANILAVR